MTLDVFITPKPSETIFSLLTRAYLLRGSVSPLTALREFTGLRGYKPLTSTPTNIRKIRESLHLDDTPQEIIRKHTLFNLFKPLLAPHRQESILQAMLDSGSVKSRLGLIKSHCGAADQLAYCCECMRDDVYRYGYPYWRREHMLVGVEVCYLHHLPLVKVILNGGLHGTRHLQLPGVDNPVIDWAAPQLERLCFIAEQVALVTNMEVDVVINCSSYLRLLEAKNVVTPSLHLRMRVLQKHVHEWLEPLVNVAPFSALVKALHVERNWVANLVAGKEGMHHPIKHIILWGALNTDYPSLIQSLQPAEQLSLQLNPATKPALSKEILVDTLQKHRTATGCARILKCSVNTILALMEKYRLSPRRKSKKLNPELIARVLELASKGYTTAKIAVELKLSVSTVNRIRRASR